jgi:hypothetical protein
MPDSHSSLGNNTYLLATVMGKHRFCDEVTNLYVYCSHECNISRKMSHTNKRPFSFLSQPSYDVEFLDIKSTSSTEEYVDPVEVLIETEGSKTTATVKATLKKEVPPDTLVSMST